MLALILGLWYWKIFPKWMNNTNIDTFEPLLKKHFLENYWPCYIREVIDRITLKFLLLRSVTQIYESINNTTNKVLYSYHRPIRVPSTVPLRKIYVAENEQQSLVWSYHMILRFLKKMCILSRSQPDQFSSTIIKDEKKMLKQLETAIMESKI